MIPKIIFSVYKTTLWQKTNGFKILTHNISVSKLKIQHKEVCDVCGEHYLTAQTQRLSIVDSATTRVLFWAKEIRGVKANVKVEMEPVFAV